MRRYFIDGMQLTLETVRNEKKEIQLPQTVDSP